MSNADIVARLQLNATQFSSETGKSFAEMKTRAASTAQEVRSSFNSAFAETQRLAQTALKIPRNASGGLDLSSEIAQLKQSAIAADQNAAALGALSIAQEAAARAARADTQALLLEADASAVGALEAEKAASAIRQRIVALEQVQGELNRTAAATQSHTLIGSRAIAITGQQRAAFQQLGFQLNDVAVGFAAGTPPMVIFAQQSGQVIQALGLMTTKTSGLLGFLGGPWGIALTSALVVLTPFVAKLFESNDALGEAIDKLKKDAEQTEATRQAKALFSRTEEGVAAAIRDGTDATQKSIDAEKSAAELANIAAKNNLQEEISIRRKTAAKLNAAIVDADNAKKLAQINPDGSEVVTAQANRAVAELRAKSIEQDALVRAAEARLTATRVDLAQEAAKRAADPIAKINRLYDEQAAAARRAARAAGDVTSALTRQLFVIEQHRQAALKATADAKTAENRKGPSLGSQLGAEQGARLLASAQGYRGVSEKTVSGRATLRDLFSEANVSIDPKITAWCAAFVNAVLATNGLPGTADLSARSFLKYGSATDRPEQGDIVVSRRGTGAQGHVGFYQGTDAAGNIQVLGGNTGDKVGTQTVARRDVLAFRRAPDADTVYAAEQRAQQLLDDALKKVTADFDSAGKAAADYADNIDKINALAAAKRISPDQQVQYLLAARSDLNALQAKTANDNFQRIFGKDAIDASMADLERQGQTAAANITDELESGFRRAGDALRDAVGSAADLFGVRLSGPLERLLQPGGIGGQAGDVAKAVRDGLKGFGVELSPKSVDRIGQVLAGAAYGQVGGGVFASITGGKQNQTASAIGGVLGEEAGKALKKPISDLFGKTLGGAAGPIGSIVGGILGNLVGGLFQVAPKGSAGVTLDKYGSLKAGVATGTTADAKSGAATLAGSVANGLQQIADLLGAKVTGKTDVQIGSYKGELRVNDHGGAIGGVQGSGAISFANESDAVAYAIADALKDGVLSGISAASLKILQSGQDLQKAINKALAIEAIPKDLKSFLDPVGAAIDALNTKFQKTVDALKEGGASAEQLAQAEQLYKLQLDQTKSSTESASKSLKDFVTSLKLGGTSPYSLRDQEATARAQLQPYLEKIGRGERIDQGKYQSAAQAFLDVERQLNGSTEAYFQALDLIQASTAKAIATIDNAVPITPGVPDPFTKATAESAAKTADGVKVQNAMTEDTNDLLKRIAERLDVLAPAGNDNGSGFIGSLRKFGATG